MSKEIQTELKGFEKVTAWQKGMELALLIYKLTDQFPKTEIYGLTSQMRRCAVSIPSNIAEGYRRFSKQEFHHFLTFSFGSGGELQTQLKIAKGLGYSKMEDYNKVDSLLDEVMKLLYTMIKEKS